MVIKKKIITKTPLRKRALETKAVEEPELKEEEEKILPEAEMDNLPDMEAVEEHVEDENNSETITKFRTKLGSMSMPKYTKIKYILSSFVVGLLIGSLFVLVYEQNKEKSVKNAASLLEKQKQDRTLDEKLADLVRLSSADKPVVGSIQDITYVANMPLFSLAATGDKVLAYKDVTIIYDEKENKIVSMVPQAFLEVKAAPESIPAGEGEPTVPANEGTSEAPVTEEPVVAVVPKEVKVEVRNGTTVTGYAGKVAKEIIASFGYTAVGKDASVKTYEGNFIVDLSGGSLSSEIEILKAKYNVTTILTALPEKEKTTEADIVLILGK